MRLPEGMLVGAIVRNGEVIIPTSSTRVQPGDSIVAVVAYRALRKAEAILAGPSNEAESLEWPMREAPFPGAWAPPYIRPVFHLTGRMLLALAAAMLLPAAVDALAGNPNWRAFLLGSVITFACGAGLTHTTRCRLSGG